MENFNIKKFKSQLQNYSPIPFWFINKIPTTAEIASQIKEMKDKGIEEFFIHARMGLEVPDYIKAPPIPGFIEE